MVNGSLKKIGHVGWSQVRYEARKIVRLSPFPLYRHSDHEPQNVEPNLREIGIRVLNESKQLPAGKRCKTGKEQTGFVAVLGVRIIACGWKQTNIREISKKADSGQHHVNRN
jgi:hypothetical protein